MSPRELSRIRLPFLDLIRAVAAFLVVLDHARNYIWKDYGELLSPSLLIRFLYFISQFGHEAVMIFFVLSGVVVGRCVVDACERGMWNWREYLFARLSRLWIVLVPSIIFTFMVDRLSIGLAPAESFVHVGGFAHIQTVPLAERLGIDVLFGNVFFLQKVLVPTFGSNGPLWSLAYEFWYYITFPLIWVGIFGHQSARARAVFIALAIASLVFVGKDIALQFPIWLLGVLAYVGRNWVNRFEARGVYTGVYLAGVITIILICASRANIFKLFHVDQLGQFVMSTCFAAFICFAFRLKEPDWMARLGSSLASFSYTLYLVHLPLLTLLVVPFIKSNESRLTPSLTAGGVLLLAIVTCYIFAVVFYMCFERQTGAYRRWFQSLRRRTVAPEAPFPIRVVD